MAEPCMSPDAAARRASKLAGWTLDTASEPLKLRFCRKLPDFRAGLAWINRVGMLAEEHDHHPDFHLTGEGYGHLARVAYATLQAEGILP